MLRHFATADTTAREDLDVPPKMARLKQWCEDINTVRSDVTYNYVFVDDVSFARYQPKSFKALAEAFTHYK
jgi:type III restriction enzyme